MLVASEPEQRRQGLRDVATLPDGVDGMLFVYPTPTNATFGMLNARFPLDIWWFDAGGRLIGTADMEPCEAEPCTAYRSPAPVVWVLETPLGTYRFETGDLISNVENG